MLGRCAASQIASANGGWSISSSIAVAHYKSLWEIVDGKRSFKSRWIMVMRVGSLLVHLPVRGGWKAWQLFAVTWTFWTFGGAIFAQAPSGVPDRAALVSELTTTVLRHGWSTDLGSMCVAMKLSPESACKFIQISVSPSEPGAIDYYGFNVPFSNASPVRYVIIFHLGPLVGNFFVVSPQGELKASFYRAKGMDYTEIPTADARRAFDTSMAFWKDNLQALKALISAGKLAKP